VHTRDVLLDLGNGLGRLGDLFPERAAVCLTCSARASRSGMLASGSAIVDTQVPFNA
jgi:hypothetical protein